MPGEGLAASAASILGDLHASSLLADSQAEGERFAAANELRKPAAPPALPAVGGVLGLVKPALAAG